MMSQGRMHSSLRHIIKNVWCFSCLFLTQSQWRPCSVSILFRSDWHKALASLYSHNSIWIALVNSLMLCWWDCLIAVWWICFLRMLIVVDNWSVNSPIFISSCERIATWAWWSRHWSLISFLWLILVSSFSTEIVFFVRQILLVSCPLQIMIIWPLSDLARGGYTMIFFIQQHWNFILRVIIIRAKILLHNILSRLSWLHAR